MGRRSPKKHLSKAGALEDAEEYGDQAVAEEAAHVRVHGHLETIFIAV